MKKLKYYYTSDKKKVALIKTINSSLFLVQEIFIDKEGKEYIGGAQFTVNAIFEEEPLSWEEKRRNEVKIEYEADRIKYRELKNSLQKRHLQTIEDIKNKIRWISSAETKLSDTSKKLFERIDNYISGKYKFFVLDTYSPEIISLEEWNESNEYGLRLVSIYGKDDGTMIFKINQYSDGSGNSKNFVPCKSKREAISVLQKHLNEQDSYSEYSLKNIEKYNLKFDKEKMKVFLQKQIDNAKKSRDNYYKTTQGYIQTIKTCSDKLKSLNTK